MNDDGYQKCPVCRSVLHGGVNLPGCDGVLVCNYHSRTQDHHFYLKPDGSRYLREYGTNEEWENEEADLMAEIWIWR